MLAWYTKVACRGKSVMEATQATECKLEQPLHTFIRSSQACRMELKDPLLDSNRISLVEVLYKALWSTAAVLK